MDVLYFIAAVDRNYRQSDATVLKSFFAALGFNGNDSVKLDAHAVPALKSQRPSLIGTTLHNNASSRASNDSLHQASKFPSS